MKQKIFFLIFSLFLLTSNAQQKVNVDSLLNVVKTDISKEHKVDTYLKIVEQIKRTDSLKAITYLKEAKDIAERINYKKGILDAKYEEAFISNLYGKPSLALDQYTELIKNASDTKYKKIIGKSYFRIGLIQKDKSEYSKSIQNNLKAAEIFEEIKDTTYFTVVYSYIAGLSLYQDNYALALEYYLKLLDISKKKNSVEGIALCYNNIGLIHRQNEEYDDAIDNYKKALAIYEKLNDSARISDCLNNIGGIHQAKEDYSEAMNYFEKSLSIRIKNNNTSSIAENYNNIGEVQFGLGNYSKSLENYFKAINLYKKGEIKQSKAYSLIGIGKAFYMQNKLSNAKQYLKDGIQLAKEISSPDIISNGVFYLSKVENKLGNYKSAYNKHLLYTSIKDSLRSNEMLKKLTIMKANFAFDQQLDSINFKNVQDQKLLTQKIESERKVNAFMIVGLLIVFVFIIILYYKNKNIRNTNLKLSQANVKLEIQRNELDNMNKTKTRFFSIIAHDIRGPIGNFIGFFDLIKEHIKEKYVDANKDDDFLDTTIGLLNTSKDQILNLLDGLINWALKESNVIPYRPENLNIKTCVEKNIDIYLQQAKAKKIKLEPFIDENISVWADKNCVMTILRNLTSNALKFSPENSSILFKASNKNNFTEIEITDQGVGMEKEKLKTLFAIDEKKTTVGTKGEKGTGLGLNIVHDFVKLNKGEITVESEINVGTTFKILLPNKE